MARSDMNILQYILPTHPHTTHRHRYLLPRDHSLDWLFWVRRNAIKVRGKKHINSMPWYYVTYIPPTLTGVTVWHGRLEIHQTDMTLFSSEGLSIALHCIVKLYHFFYYKFPHRIVSECYRGITMYCNAGFIGNKKYQNISKHHICDETR